MIIEVKYATYATCVPARGWREEEARFQGTAEVEVREASGEDAPVAVVLTALHGVGGGGRTEYRWHGGRLWREEGGAAAAAFDRWRDAGGGTPPVGGLREATDGSRPVAFAEDVPGALAERAEGLLLIDGVLHRDVGEPYWFTGHHAAGSRQLGISHAREGTLCPTGRNVARLDDAEGRERIAAEASREGGGRLVRLHGAEVRMPEALRVDPVANAAARAARDAVAALRGALRPEDLAEGVRLLAGAAAAEAARGGGTASDAGAGTAG